MSVLELFLRPGGRSLIDVVTRLPNLGIGARVARGAWVPHGDSWWEVTDVKLKGQDGSAGRVWGVLTWRGQPVDGAPRKINGAAKKVWRWLPPDAEAARLRPLAARLQAAESRERAAAAGGGEGGRK